MRKYICRILIFNLMFFLLFNCVSSAYDKVELTCPENYVFFNRDRENIKDLEFCNSSDFVGAQIKYTWKKLEPEKGEYDFSAIEEDFKFLSEKNKKLFVQLQDVSFDSSVINVPDYLIKDPEYNGGVSFQYKFANNYDSDPQKDGCVARRWDPAVSERFYKLLDKLSEKFDGQIEGIVLPENAVDFGCTGKYFPEGYTHEKYYKAIKEQMRAASISFKKSVVIQYVNFMPGEWLPSNNEGYLEGVFEYARSVGIGIGGPDVIPYQKSQMNHSYSLANRYSKKLTVGFAVQEGNYEQINETTGKQLTVKEIYDFAKNYLGAKYIFWYPQDPYFEGVKAFLHPENKL